MKELTIEEKAKAYDEAIKKLRDFYRDYNTISGLIDVKEELANIFPELKESEDEKIRKRIIQALHGDVLDMEETAKAIAWIEKQGEHANFINKIQIGDKVIRNEDGVLANVSQLNRVAKKDEKQGEQKTTWSEEDEAMYEGVIETEQYMLDVVHGRKIFAVGNLSIMGECAKELTWLNSRFKKLLEQLKQL